MRKYETFFIVDAELPDEALASVDDKLKNIVTNNGGMMVDYVPWGKKKLAYPVKKRTRGHYVLMEFAAESSLVAELERNMRLDERVLKFITVKLEDRFDLATLQERQPKAAPRFGDADEEILSSAEKMEEEEMGEGEEYEEEDVEYEEEEE